jgi:C4-dicarboxylate-specific signal transduction histidine kinase
VTVQAIELQLRQPMDKTNGPESIGDAGFDLAAFTRGLAHELGNPLHSMSLNAEATKLLIARNDAHAAAERLGALVADCARCARLLQGVRRFGAGITPDRESRQQVTVAQLVDAACSLLRAEGSRAPAVEVAGSQATLLVNRTALARAVVELLRNSVEAGSASVRIVVGEVDGDITVDLFDDGTGIPEQLRGMVMQPFFSTRRNEGNAGLGLTLVQELVRDSGGSVSIGCGAERGACMRLRLPRLQCTAQG